MASARKKRLPKWQDTNLRNHYRKHPAGKDEECWKDLLSTDRRVSEAQYHNTSLEVFDEHWLEYETQLWDVAARRHREARGFFVDDRLIVVVTDLDRETIITCYHDHWHSRGKHRSSENNTSTVGERRELFRRMIENACQDGRIKSFEKLYEDG